MNEFAAFSPDYGLPLVGTMEKWNDAKKAEERDRVKHGLKGGEKHDDR